MKSFILKPFNFKPYLLFTLFIILLSGISVAQNSPSDLQRINNKEAERADDCTTVTVGKSASFDGSVITSHVCDSHRDRTWINIVPAQKHKKGSMKVLYNRINDDSNAMPRYKFIAVGEIPEVDSTYGFINSAVRCLNDRQLAIGESTFDGRGTLKSDKGLLQYEELTRLILERCASARAAIKLAAELTEKYGWVDDGECFTIADTKEVWHLEIIGPGKGNTGSIWAAQRVPDGHVSINANASRIRQIDLNNSDYFMASRNVFTVAQDSGWWNPEDGPFQFCYAYDPGGRTSFANTRREWRVFDLLAPSLKLNPNSENYPFSVKPDSLVTLEKLVSVFQDYYEGTEFNFVKNITWVNKDGKTEISPMANPFMPYDMNRLFKINGGWGWRGERTIARWYTVYTTIIQLREWLPDQIGGVAWFAWDNVATSVFIPLYCSISDVPESYKTPGRKKGFSRGSAWWAFNRLGTIAAQRWGDMRKDVGDVWNPLQKKLFKSQPKIENHALELYRKDPLLVRQFLTKYSNQWGEKAVKEAWKLGDFLWTKYDEKF